MEPDSTRSNAASSTTRGRVGSLSRSSSVSHATGALIAAAHCASKRGLAVAGRGDKRRRLRRPALRPSGRTSRVARNHIGTERGARALSSMTGSALTSDVRPPTRQPRPRVPVVNGSVIGHAASPRDRRRNITRRGYQNAAGSPSSANRHLFGSPCVTRSGSAEALLQLRLHVVAGGERDARRRGYHAGRPDLARQRPSGPRIDPPAGRRHLWRRRPRRIRKTVARRRRRGPRCAAGPRSARPGA